MVDIPPLGKKLVAFAHVRGINILNVVICSYRTTSVSGEVWLARPIERSHHADAIDVSSLQSTENRRVIRSCEFQTLISL